ncbi:MAG: hypothetical protein AABX59_02030 [Nanoarchaeota archaeon]
MDERESVCREFFGLSKKRISGLRSDLRKEFYSEGLREIWTAFDAFLGWKYPAVSNKLMRERFSKDFQSVFNSLKKSDMFIESFDILVKLSPVQDMAPVNPKPDLPLTSASDLIEILNYSYRIRSNLDHGGKDLFGNSASAERNRQLVEHAFKVTYETLEKTLSHNQLI